MATVEKVTLTLPHDLMDEVRELTPPRGRNKFVAEALHDFIKRRRMETLRAELAAGYQATADEATATAEAWMPLGQEAWEQNETADEEERGDDAAMV